MELSCLIIRSQLVGTSGTKYPTVICSGAGKELPRTRDAITYPHFIHVRLKSLSRLPDGRHAVQIKGAARKRLQAGVILIAAGQAPHRSRVGYGISVRKIPPGSYTAVGGLFREHALPGPVEVTESAGGYRMSSHHDLPLVVGGRYRLTPTNETGSHRMPLELLLCIPQEVDREAKRHLASALSETRREVSMVRFHAVLFGLVGWVELPEHLGVKRVREALKNDARFGTAAVELSAEPNRLFLMDPTLLKETESKLQREIHHGNGETIDTLAVEVGYPQGLVEAIINRMEQEGDVARHGGVVLATGKEAGLSPMERGLIEKLTREAEGGSLGRADKGVDRSIMQKLLRLRVVVELGDCYLPMETYAAFTDRLLHGRKPGGAITIAEAKTALGLPREQTIHFLESLDQRGVLRRDGDVHRVVRGLEIG